MLLEPTESDVRDCISKGKTQVRNDYAKKAEMNSIKLRSKIGGLFETIIINN